MMFPAPTSSRPRRRGYVQLSIGAWVILLLAVVCTALVAARRDDRPPGMEMWVFARAHHQMYEAIAREWNAARPPLEQVHLLLLSNDAMIRRVNAGFMSDVPVGSPIEVERNMAGRTFSGPVEDIGWTDLTDLIRAEGLDREINAPSFDPWTWRGRVYGLPHDVHPVMLAYRADLVEAAGIDVGAIETWDDFARVMAPLQGDADGDGAPDRYLLNLWTTSLDQIECLVLQAGGGFFDAAGRVTLDTPENARVLCAVVAWTAGPGRIAADAPEFSAGGNKLRLDGYVVCSLMPDWLGGVWKLDMPQLQGKVKLMPLPAWERGGRRTSVWGGTMLGLPRRTADFDAAWRFARHLYLSDDLARELYRTNGIISPVKRLWSDPMYDEPDPYFAGQAPGRLYVRLAPDVPPRVSSPFHVFARQRFQDALLDLRAHALDRGVFDPEALRPEARRLLAGAQAAVQAQVDRNVFVRQEAP